MNVVKLQDTKLMHRILFHFYTLTMEDQKEKLRKQFHLPLYEEGNGNPLPYSCLGNPVDKGDWWTNTFMPSAVKA